MGASIYVRAGNVLWKFCGFCLCFIVIPTTMAFFAYFLAPAIFPNPSSPYYGAILAFIGGLGLSSRLYSEKFRQQTIFQDNINVFDAEILSPFIVLLLAIVIEPLGTLFSNLPYVLEVFTNISLLTIFSVIWILFYHYFFRREASVKCTPLYSIVNQDLSRSLHAPTYSGMYVVEILFIELLHNLPLVWYLALIIPLIFFGLTWVYTRPERRFLRRILAQNAMIYGIPLSNRDAKYFQGSIWNRVNVVEFDSSVKDYLQKLTKMGITVIFLLSLQFLLQSVQINASQILANPIQEWTYALGFCLLGTVYSKVQVDLTLVSKLERSWKEKFSPKTRMLQNFNVILTSITVCLIFGWSLGASTQYLALGILVGCIVVAYFEAKRQLYGKFSEAVQLLCWSMLGMNICWGILPVDWIYQFIAFLLFMHLVLEGAKRVLWFREKNITMIHNILVTTVIYAVLYAIYPPIVGIYLFSTDPAVILIAHSLFVSIFLLIAIIAFLYQLSFSLFHGQAPEILKKTLTASTILFLSILVAIIDFRLFLFLDFVSFIKAVLASSLLVPIAFLGFTILDLKIGVLSEHDQRNYNYFSAWVLNIIITIFIGFLFPTFSGILTDVLYFLIVLQAILQFGVRIQKISESFRQAVSRVSSYLFAFVAPILFYDVFANQLFLNFFTSVFLSLCIMTGIAHVLSYQRLFSAVVKHYLTIFTLFFLPLMVFFNALLWFNTTPYLYVAPLLLASIAFILPNVYALKAIEARRESFAKILKINFQVLASLIGALQVPDAFYQILPGAQINIISVVSSSYVVYAMMIVLFASLGTFLHLYSKQEFTNICYYAAWPLLPTIFLIIFSNNLNISGLSWGVLFASFYLQLLVYWTNSRSTLEHFFYNKFTNINSIAFLIGVFGIFYGVVPSSFFTSVYAIFVGLCGMCGAAWFFFRVFSLYPPKYVRGLISFTAYFFLLVVFYYTVLGIFPSLYRYIIPLLLVAAISIPSHFIAHKLDLIKQTTFINLVNLSIFTVTIGICCIPVIIGLDVVRTGVFYSPWEVLLCFLLFVSAYGLEKTSSRFEFHPRVINFLRKGINWIWLATTILTPIYIIQAIFPTVHFISIPIATLVFFSLNVFTLKVLKLVQIGEDILQVGRNFIFFGINFSISGIFASILQDLQAIPIFSRFVSPELALWDIIWYFSAFALCNILIFNLQTRYGRQDLSRWMEWINIFSWFYLKGTICLGLTLILPITSILIRTLAIIATGAVLSPITLFFLEKIGRGVQNRRPMADQLIALVFTATMVGIYLLSFSPTISTIPVFATNPELGIFLGTVNTLLFLNFSVISYKRLTITFQPGLANNEVPTNDSPSFKWMTFFGASMGLFMGIFFQIPLISPLLLLITIIITLNFRNANPLLRIVQVFLLSCTTYITWRELVDSFVNIVPENGLTTDLHNFGITLQQDYFAFGDHILFYLISLLMILIFSIAINRKQKYFFEAITTFVVISAIIFTSLQLFSIILLPNIVMISLLVFLLQVTPFLFYYKHPYAIWFANICLVLIVFVCLNFLSYQALFAPADFGTAKNILAFTLTLSGTLLTFVIRFNKLPELLRRYSYIGALTGLIAAIPTFVYFLLLEAMPALQMPISLAISLNIGILLFFLSTAIYQWRFSRAIWQAAWWGWLLLPIINYIIIAELLGGIDVVTNALTFFGTMNLPGSIILTVISCTMLYLPVFYTKAKAYFHIFLFIIWGEALFLVAWIAQMLFGPYIFLSSGFFGIMAIFCLIPLLYILKSWKILEFFWILMTAINAAFLYGYLSFIGISWEKGLFIDMIAVGIFLIIFSFFPQLKYKGLILSASYGTVLIGVFFLVYQIIAAVTLNPPISVNLSFIILALSLFSSKYLKINQKNIHLAIAIILISNTSLLVLFSFIVIPGLERFAIFLFLAVFGGSFYVFNWYEMIKPIDARIPWGIMAVGCALAISDLCFVYWQVNEMFLAFTFSSILLLFLFHNLTSYRYVLWVFYPIPLTFLIQSFLLPILGSMLIFSWISTYIALFQLIFNVNYRRFTIREKVPQQGYLEVLQRKDIAKLVNAACFLLNSVFFALAVTIVSPFSWINQVFEFFILWSLFTILSLKYMKNTGFQNIESGLFKILQSVTLFFYIMVPIATCFNIGAAFILSGLQITNVVMQIILIFNVILFIELYLIDRLWVVAVFPKIRNQWIIWSWLVLANVLSIQLFLVYTNLFFFLLILSVLNLVSVYFLGSLEIPEKIINTLRWTLLYLIIIELSLFLASLLMMLEESAIPASVGGSSASFFLVIFTLTYLNLSQAFKKNLPAKFFHLLNLGIFIGFQITFSIYYLTITQIFNAINLPAICVLLIGVTLLSYFLVYFWSKCIPEERQDSARIFGNTIVQFSWTLEVPLLCYSLLFEILPVVPSLLITDLALLILSIIELNKMEGSGRKFMQVMHAISYVILSILTVLFLLPFTAVVPAILGLSIFILISMQFYSNVSIIRAIQYYNPEAADQLTAVKTRIQTAIGLCFYGSILFFLQQAVSITNLIEQFFVLFLGLYLLMLAEQRFFKFIMNTISQWILALGWAGMQLFLALSVWQMILQSVGLLPLFIVLNLGGVAYLVNLLNGMESIAIWQSKINQILAITTYITLVVWPFFFVTTGLLVNVSLAFGSLGILLGLSYVDDYIKAIGVQLRKSIRKVCQMAIGAAIAGGISYTMSSTISFYFTRFRSELNVCFFLLFFTSIVSLYLRPFKRHSPQALGFWYMIFTLIGLILYFFIGDLLIPIIFITVFLFAYWVIFVVNVRQFLIRCITAVYMQFRAIFLSIKNALTRAYQILLSFWNAHFRALWMSIWSIFSLAASLSVWLFVAVPIASCIAIGLLIFVIAMYVLLARYIKEKGENTTFKIELLYYASVYFSSVWTLFSFFTWNIFLILGSILLFGGVLLFFVDREWKQKRIGDKGRFLAIVAFLALFGVTAVLLILQYTGKIQLI